jgi:DNA-binding IclR family transcriptional regulator
VVDQQQLVWIGSAQGAPAGLMYQPSMGGRIVSFATANGKAWLATLTDEAASAIALKDGLGRKPANIGPKAIMTLEALRQDLETVRARGFALADEEAEPGVAAIAVAIRDPVSGQALGTTSIAGPVVRLPAERHEAVVRRLQAAAQELAQVWPLGEAVRLQERRGS